MMLKDGKFIRESPPVIGINYHRTESREYTEEEVQWQETFLATEEIQDDLDLSETILWIVLIVLSHRHK